MSSYRSLWRRHHHLISVSLLVVAAGCLYFVRLGTPNVSILDEERYVNQAKNVLQYGTESDTRALTSGLVLHPPAGKWFIAAGIRIFGDRPIGWRFFGALFGVLSVVITYRLGLRLLGSARFALIAGIFLAVDGLWFVQSRTAMLDIYVAVFILAGTWMLVEDHYRSAGPRRGLRWWRICSGILFGLALATKWSALPFIGAAAGLAAWWEIIRDSPPKRLVPYLQRLLPVAGTFLALPAMLYIASYAPWFFDNTRYSIVGCETHTLLKEWACNQKETLESLQAFKSSYQLPTVQQEGKGTSVGPPEGTVVLTNSQGRVIFVPPKIDSAHSKTIVPHPSLSHAWSWPWISRPTVNYAARGDLVRFDPSDEAANAEGYVRAPMTTTVIGLPNPAVWLPGFLIAVPVLAWWTIRRRGPTASLVVLFLAAGSAPFLISDVLSRQVFFYYATPLVPFVVLGTVHALARLVARWQRVGMFLIVYVVISIATFAFFYPVTAAVPLSGKGLLGFNARMWVEADCAVRDRIQKFCWRPVPKEHEASLTSFAWPDSKEPMTVLSVDGYLFKIDGSTLLDENAPLSKTSSQR